MDTEPSVARVSPARMLISVVLPALEAGKDAQQGRLAGAVGSQQREEFTFRDLQVDAAQGMDPGETLVQAAQADGGGHGRESELIRDAVKLGEAG